MASKTILQIQGTSGNVGIGDIVIGNINKTLKVGGTLGVTDDTTIGGTFTVGTTGNAKTTTLNGDTTVGGTLGVTGVATVNKLKIGSTITEATGIGVSSGQLAPNAGNLTSNKLVKASSGGLTNSNITDDGTTVTIEKPIKATSGVSATNAAATTGKFTGDLIGNALTADTLKTSRTLKIGNTNKDFDGSANVAWTHNEIGVSQGSHVVYSYGGFGDQTGSAWGWVRIAETDCWGYGTFTISKSYSSGSPRAVKFFVAPSHFEDNNGWSIVQLGGTNARFSKARIVYDPTNESGYYIEVYYQQAFSVYNNNLFVSLSNSYRTTLLTSATQGEIPDGWASYECNFTDNGLSAKSGLFNNLVIDKGANNETGSLTIGSSSAPATLNVYGKSTLRDRLTVPKDGSNNTSGIIDAGDSYYLGGNRWIHNQGGNTCTAVGYDALRDNTEGSYNCAMGSAALRVNTTGRDNLAVGYAALRANTEGSYNSAIGYALVNNTLGNNNSAMGYTALHGNVTGSYNSAMGYRAGRYIANGSTNKTTGDNNLYLGSETKAKENGTNNEIVIGAYAIGLGSNSMVLGHTTNLLTALRGKVGIGTDAPEHGLHVGTSYDSDNNIISDGNIKANNKLIAGTHVEAGGNVTAVETVQGKDIAAVASGDAGGYINADRDINAGYDITAQNNVTGFVVNAIKNINAGNNITATETVTGKNLVATQSISAGTTIDAGALTVSGATTLNGATQVNNTLTVANATMLNGTVEITNNTASNSTTTGALKVSGGAGIGGAINVGGKAKITDATQATATGAALEVTGGIKAGDNLLVNNSAEVGSLVSGGVVSAVGNVSSQANGVFSGNIIAGKGGRDGNIIANHSVQIGETLRSHNGGELIITDNKYDNNYLIDKGFVNAGHTIMLSGTSDEFDFDTILDKVNTSTFSFIQASNETVQAEIMLNLKLIVYNSDLLTDLIVFEETVWMDAMFRDIGGVGYGIQTKLFEKRRASFKGGNPEETSFPDSILNNDPFEIRSDNPWFFGSILLDSISIGNIMSLLGYSYQSYFNYKIIYSIKIDSNSIGMPSLLAYASK